MGNAKKDVLKMKEITSHSKSSLKAGVTNDASFSPALKGAVDVNLPQSKALDGAISVIPFMLKTVFIVAVVGFAVWWATSSFKNRFIKRKYRSDLPASNISDGEAQSRAAAISGSIGWFSSDFETVKSNIDGLNYNGFIKLYNAFGHHTGTLLGGELDLEEWIRNQFDQDQILELSFLLNGAFFQ